MDESDLRRWRLLLDARLLLLVLITGVATFPDSPLPPDLGLFSIAVVLPANLGLRVMLGWGIVPVWLPTLDSVLLAAVLAIDPSSVAAVGVMLLAGASQSIAAGWRATILASLAGVPVIAFALVRYAPDQAELVMFAHLAVTPVVTWLAAAVAESRRDSRRRSVDLLEQIDAIVWEARPYPFEAADMTGRCDEMVGFSGAELSRPGAWLDRVLPTDRPRVVQASRAAIDVGDDHELSYRVITAAGEVRHVRDRVTVATGHDGRPTVSRGVIVDVSEESRVRASNQSLAELVQRVHAGLVVVEHLADDGTFVVREANPAYEALSGLPHGALIGRPIGDSAGPARGKLESLLQRVQRSGTPEQIEEISGLAGDDRVLSLEAFPITRHSLGLNVVDVTDRVRTAESLRHQALHDELTGLPNRALLEDRLGKGIDSAVRHGRAVALLMLDLNQFKDVNDTLGHDHGDRLLVQVAKRLAASLRAGDTVARLGGDEFAVLLVDDVSPRNTLRTAQRLLATFDHPFDIDGLSLQCSASLGIALYPEHSSSREELRRHADIAMYAAKRRGGGLAVFDPERDRPDRERLTFVSELRQGIDEGQLTVHYQPLVDVETGRIDQVEALVRWEHPLLGLVGPGDFIEAAEASGVIRPLTRWVLHRVTRDVAELESAGLTLGASVNVSVRNLFEPAFVENIRAALADSHLEGHRLTVEITETQVMDDPELTHTVLGRLAELGIRGSVDDFGTGYSSLASLQSLPIHEVKIDRSFVTAMGRGDEAATTIVRSTVSLAHNLGLEVVAEGVENNEALTRLALFDCDRMQGFFLARPMDLTDLRARLERQELTRPG